MPETREAGRRVAPRTGFRIVFAGAMNDLERTPGHRDRQADRLARRFRLSPATATLVAELAFRAEVRR